MPSETPATTTSRPQQQQQRPVASNNVQPTRSRHEIYKALCDSNRLNFAVGILVFALAVVGIWAQFRANAIGAKANAIAQNQLNVQLWDDCHDRQVYHLRTSSESLLAEPDIFRILPILPCVKRQ